jgi:anti-anti-sigma factor
MTGDYLHVRRAPNGETEILHVSGVLDIRSVPILERAVAAEAEGAQTGVTCLDLRGLTFIDSTGARMLLRVHNAAQSRGQRLFFASPRRNVRVVLEILGLDQALQVGKTPNGNDSENRRVGGRVRGGGGWGDLTPADRQVAGLVAQGLTNRQVAERMFLSRHTVDFHLRQIFRKLGIKSRIELVRMTLAQAPEAER